MSLADDGFRQSPDLSGISSCSWRKIKIVKARESRKLDISQRGVFAAVRNNIYWVGLDYLGQPRLINPTFYLSELVLVWLDDMQEYRLLQIELKDAHCTEIAPLELLGKCAYHIR